MAKNKYHNWDREARESLLERNYKELCRGIFQNEQLIKWLMTAEGAKDIDDPMRKISDTEQYILKQKIELNFLTGLIDEFYAKK